MSTPDDTPPPMSELRDDDVLAVGNVERFTRIDQTVVPSDFFDQLLDDPDDTDIAPALIRAAERVQRTDPT